MAIVPTQLTGNVTAGDGIGKPPEEFDREKSRNLLGWGHMPEGKSYSQETNQ